MDIYYIQRPTARLYIVVVDLLQKSGIHNEFYTTPGEHEWKAWRHLLAELMPKLFQPAAN